MERQTVVIVDSYRERAEAVGEALNGDFDCVVVGEADQALREIRETLPVAVIVDFPFPSGDRRCLSRDLTDDPTTTEIPLIAYSGWDFSNTRAKAAALGCDAFVARSEGPTAVADTVSALVGEGAELVG